jgi:hypothetical protein
MSAALTNCPAVTATPESLRLPAAGSVEILTAASALPEESLESLMPKSAAENVCDVSSSTVSERFVPAGASLTDVTSTVIVFDDASSATPPFDVPPSSCTWKVKLA